MQSFTGRGVCGGIGVRRSAEQRVVLGMVEGGGLV